MVNLVRELCADFSLQKGMIQTALNLSGGLGQGVFCAD